MDLRKLIEEHLKSNKKTQSQLAREAGVSQTVINRFLRGERGITWANVEKILKVIKEK